MNLATFSGPPSTFSSISTRQPDVFPDTRPRHLYRASVYIAESKRLILVEMLQIFHRGTWLALTALAEVCTHLLVALERLSAGEK